MAWELPLFKMPGVKAGADLSAKQYYLVKPNSDADEIVESTVAGEVVMGALQNKPTENLAAEVTVIGVTPLVAGAAITKGAKLMAAGTTGKAITAATTGSHIIGYALEGAAGDGSVFTAFINCGTGVV